MTVTCFTSATFAYIDRALVLARSVRRHHPEWRMVIVLPDEAPSGVDVDDVLSEFDDVRRMRDIGVPQTSGWIFEHDVVELCTAVKGQMLFEMLEESDKVVYLDPDIALLARLDEVIDLLDHNDVVLTPHCTQPATERQEILDNEIGSLKHGVYNLGFVAVANRSEGRRFARWWADRLIEFCFDELEAGLFTDQRWVDLAPALFESVHVLRHQGYNVASWNMAHRPFEFDDGGTLLTGGDPIRFYHFTKVNLVGEQMIERYRGDSIIPIELLQWYRRQLFDTGVEDRFSGWWAYAEFADGTPIERRHRRAFRDDASIQSRLPEPFEATLHDFESVMEPSTDIQELHT